MTGLYWAWKNLDADYIGLAHYRRHFGAKHHHGKNRLDWVIKSNELLPMLEQYSILLPKKDITTLKLCIHTMSILTIQTSWMPRAK